MSKRVSAVVARAGFQRALDGPAPSAMVAQRPFMPPGFEREGKRMPKRLSFTKLVKRTLDLDDPQSTEIMRRLAANAVGAQPEDVPSDLVTPAEFAVWVSSMLAAAGSIEHLRELSDRAAPKPRRVELEVSGTVRHAMTGGAGEQGAARVSAAQDYYALLDGAIDVEYEEVPTPAAPSAGEPGEDLSFLE